MSTSLLYHGFGLVHQQCLKTEYEDGKIIFNIQTKPEELRCSCCNSYRIKYRGFKERIFKAQPIGRKQVYLKAIIRRLECLDCGHIRQEAIKYADYKKSYTRGFQRYVLDLSKMMTIQDVSETLGVGWDLVKGIQKQYLEKHYGHPDLKNVKSIAIDEIAIQKGHKYLTVVMDLGIGAVVFVGDGKDSDCLLPFWKRLKHSGAKIESVAIDMSPAYIESVTKNLTSAKIVFDHFHIIKMYNDSLSELRCDLYNFEKDKGKKNY
jgi:transposase